MGVVLLHAAGQWTISTQEMSQLNISQFLSWTIVDVYQSLARIGVPLFVMLTGALLLQPEKNENLRTFFKKRWARIGLPFIFWGIIYFIWDFVIIKVPFSAGAIIQGVFNGPYAQFWYMYVLFGLYFLTPILRVFLAQADKTMIKYFIVLWFLGMSIVPVFTFFTSYTVNSNVFLITGYVGYYVLGTYLLTVNVRRSTLWAFMLAGIALTAFFTYVLAVTLGGVEMYFFQSYYSPTIILASVMLFMLLLTVPPPSTEKETELSKGNRLIRVLSENTLPIFFVHVIILESLEFGYFGFVLDRHTFDPILEVPFMTAIVLFASLGLTLLLKQVPYLKKLIG